MFFFGGRREATGTTQRSIWASMRGEYLDERLDDEADVGLGLLLDVVAHPLVEVRDVLVPGRARVVGGAQSDERERVEKPRDVQADEPREEWHELAKGDAHQQPEADAEERPAQ